MPRVRPARHPRLESLEARTLLRGAVELAWVGFDPRISLHAEQRLLERVNATVVDRFPGGSVQVEFQGLERLNARFALLARNPAVRYVERDTPIKVDPAAWNDPLFESQWSLNNPNNADIDAPEAWSRLAGAPVVVAVIDSGLDILHPDLVDRIWVNPREIPGNNLDDDGNGYADDINGWNFLYSTPHVNDEAGHGTHVSGIIAATANNGIGIAGVNPLARIMPLKFIEADGDGSISHAVRAIHYATQNGARVINASWGGSVASRALEDAIRVAGNRGVVFVTASGNEGLNSDIYRSYPSSYRLPNALVVAAADSTGRLARFSNFGRRTVDLVAPGVSIRSTTPGGRYEYMSGTSMATPFVAGVASLLIGANPDWTAAQVVRRILGTTKPLPGLADRTVTGGMISAARALDPSVPTLLPTVNRPSTTPAQAARLRAPLPALRLGVGDKLRAEIYASHEYYARHGETPEGFLSAVYSDVLGRAPSASEHASGIHLLNAGVQRAALVRSILGRREAFRIKVARWLATDLGGSASLDRLTLTTTTNRLTNRLVAGTAESRVRAEWLASALFRQQVAGSSHELAAAFYQFALGRPASPSELEALTPRLAIKTSRENAALGLLKSFEGRLQRVAAWFRADLGRPEPLEQLKSDPAVIALAQRLTD